MRKDTQKLAAWAKGKPLGVTLPAILAASSTEDVRQFLHERRTHRGIFASRPAIDETQWLRFYRSPKSLERTLLAELGTPKHAAATKIFNALRDPKRATPRALKYAFGAILYGVAPVALLRRVNQGGKPAETAARQLVRLDATAMRTPPIKRWERSDGANGAYRPKKLFKWANQAPFDHEKAPSRALKIVAARISYLSELLDCRLNAPDLRTLLELCQQPANCQAFLDASTDDDFGRAIRRVKQLFTGPAKADRSMYESVRALVG